MERAMNWLPRPASCLRALRRLVGAAGVLAVLGTAGQASAQSVIRDTEIEGVIREWSDPVFDAMGLVPADVEVLLINDPELNAFATRGRIMGLNTGLILQTLPLAFAQMPGGAVVGPLFFILVIFAA